MAGKLSINQAVESVEKGLAQRIKAMTKELTRWQTQRQEAEAREERCLREINEMEMAIAVLRRSLGMDSSPPATDQLEAIKFRNQTVVLSCIDILRASGGRARVVDITKALVVAGKIRGRSAYSSVVKAMDRDPRFRRVGKGLFQLVDSESPQLKWPDAT